MPVMKKMPRRFLVEWTEKVTYRDIAFVDEEVVRESMSFTSGAWEQLGETGRDSMIRVFLNDQRNAGGLGGTRRWKVADRAGFDVIASAEWPMDEDEPAL